MPVSIHNLPVETLSHIFVHLLSVNPPNTFPLVLRLVCKRWQAVAEQTPEIWPSLATGHGIEWTRRSLKLSKSSPLDVTLHAKGSAVERLTLESLVLAQLPRIRKLVFITRTIPSEITTLLSNPAPLLEESVIMGEWTMSSLNISGSLFHSPPPRLVHLKMTNVRIPSTCPVFQAPLTRLHVNACGIWDTFSEFMEMLPNLVRLQSLVLIQSIDTGNIPALSIQQSYSQRLEMADMRCFCLDNDVDVLHAVMTRISLPRDCDVDLTARVFEIEDLAEFITALDEIFVPHLTFIFHAEDSRDTNTCGFTRAEIADHGWFRGSIESSVTWTIPNVADLDNARLKMTIDFPDTHVADELLDILHHTLERWSGTSSCISHLSVNSSDLFDVNSDGWCRVLNHFEALADLTVVGNAARALSKALDEDNHEHLSVRLEKFTLRDVRISQMRLRLPDLVQAHDEGKAGRGE